MEPFALVKMMGTFVANGMTGRIVLYLLLLAAGLRRAYVSGQLALRDGEMCKTRAGRVLRRDDKKG